MTGLEVAFVGWFVVPVISKLADLVVFLVKKEIKYQKGVKGKLKTLAEDLKKIRATIYAAHRLQINNPALQRWHLELMDAAKAAENVLNKFNGNIAEERKEPAHPRGFTKGTYVKRLFFRDAYLNELNDVVKRFGKIAAEMGHFLKLAELDLVIRKHREMLGWQQTTSMPIESNIVGRDKERNDMVNFLLATGDNHVSGNNDENFAVMSIVGIQGVGKTTLARCVYNDRNIKEHFDIKVWLSVSDEFNVKRLMIEIIESACIDRPHDLHALINLDTIQGILNKVLMAKRFLIVFDGITSDQIAGWETLWPSFKFGKKGSRIILTTCDQNMGEMMEMRTINLKGIEGQDYRRLFERWASRGVNPRDRPILESVVTQVAPKLGGSPFAAKMVGVKIASMLREQGQKNGKSKL